MTATAVGEYLDGLRAALAGLPASEIDEIVDDARTHLRELSAELGPEAGRAELETRLGTPAAYAAELRAAAGYPEARPPARPANGRPSAALTLLVGSVLLALTAAVARDLSMLLFALVLAAVGLALIAGDGPRVPSVAALPLLVRLRSSRPEPGTPARALLDFLVSLQPGWWVARAFAVAVVAAVWLGFPGLAVVVVALVGLPVSVWIGHRSRSDHRWWWAVAPLNTVAVVMLLIGAALVSSFPRSPVTIDVPGLAQDGVPITNIRPFDSFGNPLGHVYLFDQDGRPIDAGQADECTPPSSGTVPSGAPYPRDVGRFDPATGECVSTAPGPLAVSIPKPTPTQTPTTKPTASPTTPAAAPTTTVTPPR